MLLNSNQDYIEYLIFVGFYWVKWVVDAGTDWNFIANIKIKHELKKACLNFVWSGTDSKQTKFVRRTDKTRQVNPSL